MVPSKTRLIRHVTDQHGTVTAVTDLSDEMTRSLCPIGRPG